MSYIPEQMDLLEKVKRIDIRHEFKKEWENDTEMINMFIELNIRRTSTPTRLRANSC